MTILRYRPSPLTRRPFFAEWNLPDANDRTWPAAIDILTRNSDLVIRVELPGIDPEKDVEVSLEGHRLTVSGERRFENEDEGETYHRIERSYGRFERSVLLPEHVTESDIHASYIDGVLEVVVAGGSGAPAAARIAISKGEAAQVTSGKTGSSEAGEDADEPEAGEEAESDAAGD